MTAPHTDSASRGFGRRRSRWFRIATSGLLALALASLARAASDRALSPDEVQAMVTAHNAWRRRLGVGDIQWSTALAMRAQAWADRLARDRDCALDHSRAGDVGENLFWASAILTNTSRMVEPVTPADVVEAWAAERADYDAATNRCAAGQHCGHFTQLVWKHTRELGCGRAVCERKSQVWICNYAPAGNLTGERPF